MTDRSHADQDRQTAMRDREGEVLARVERVRKWADRWLEHYHSIRPDLDAILAQVERDQAVFATAITEAEQAARAAGRAEAAQVVRNRACGWMAIARDKLVTAEYVTDDFSLVEQQIRDLAAKPPQPQKPEE